MERRTEQNELNPHRTNSEDPNGTIIMEIQSEPTVWRHKPNKQSEDANVTNIMERQTEQAGWVHKPNKQCGDGN